MRIDSHQHFWRPARGDYTWLRADEPGLAPLVREFLPHDLELVLQANKVPNTVLVQAADSVAETRFLLELADRHDFIRGVVGWVDLGRSDVVAALEGLARHPRFKGVRPMLQDLPEDDWIEHGPHREAAPALIRLGLRFDALVKQQHLTSLLRFARAWPELPIVIDHAAKPPLASGWPGDWVRDWSRNMVELAALPKVYCKFSGLLTEMTPQQRVSTASSVACLRPVWDALLQWFGPARLMWGSDWPVSTLAGSYAAWVSAAGSLIGELSADDQALVWHGTAQRFYGIE